MNKLVTRKQAIKAGVLRYFTGVACKFGHVSERFVSSCVCMQCSKIKSEIARLADPEKYRAACRSWQRRNPNYSSMTSKRSREQNPQHYKEYAARYRKENGKELAAGCVKWRKNNQAKVKLYNTQYALTHRAERSATQARRRAKQANAGGHHTIAQIQALRALQKDKCAYCKNPLCGGGQADHIVALVRGGTDDISNIQLTCGKCNRRKSAKCAIAFAQENGLLL